METKLGWQTTLIEDYNKFVEETQRYLVLSKLTDQEKYERIVRLLYLRGEFEFGEFVEPENMRFRLEQLEISDSMPLFVLMALSISLGLIYYLNIKVFDSQLIDVMSIFLNL